MTQTSVGTSLSAIFTTNGRQYPCRNITYTQYRNIQPVLRGFGSVMPNEHIMCETEETITFQCIDYNNTLFDTGMHTGQITICTSDNEETVKNIAISSWETNESGIVNCTAQAINADNIAVENVDNILPEIDSIENNTNIDLNLVPKDNSGIEITSPKEKKETQKSIVDCLHDEIKDFTEIDENVNEVDEIYTKLQRIVNNEKT